MILLMNMGIRRKVYWMGEELGFLGKRRNGKRREGDKLL